MTLSLQRSRKVRCLLRHQRNETNCRTAGGQGGKGSSKAKVIREKKEGSNNLETSKTVDVPKAKSKNLDVLAEFEKTWCKNAANFVVIGISILTNYHPIISNFDRSC